MNSSTTAPRDIKRTFLRLGTCSRTLCFILNRGFGHPLESEERAADPLAGGILRQGYQCGMLWGSTLAAGAESFRRHPDRARAIGQAIVASQHLVASFAARTNTTDCMDITDCDWTSKTSMAKYFLTGRVFSCFMLAEKWAPEAIQSATDSLAEQPSDLPQQPMSCASEVARRMGASEQEAIMVEGFAGGIGLSGNACGALGAAIWMRALAWYRQHPGKAICPNSESTGTLEAFYAATNHEILCHKIAGQRFATVADHTEYIRCGGCRSLIEALAQR